MTDQAYEILCPQCRTPLAANAARCPRCSGKPAERLVAAALPAPPPPMRIESDAIARLKLKDYHELVRLNHLVNEGYRTTGVGSPLVPAALLFLLAFGAALAFLLGWF